jgi:hypothetical protein
LKNYTYEGVQYVESGEVRTPKRGEIFLQPGNIPIEAHFDFSGRGYPILIPKEKVKMDEEYNVPVLVKANNNWSNRVQPYAGRVILCQRLPSGNIRGPKGVGEGGNGLIFSENDPDLIPYPSQDQVEAEQTKLKPKTAPLPAPVRAALDAADLGCRRDGVSKLIEAIYANPPKGGA